MKDLLEAAQADFDKKVADLRSIFIDKLATLVCDKKSAGISDLYGTEVIAKGETITRKEIRRGPSKGKESS